MENAFTRVWDDSLVVKALDTGDVEDVTFRDCTLWNDFARPMEVGVELRADRVRRVKFQDIDVLHSLTGYPLMGIHHGDRALVSDILFEDIRIEDAPGAQLFDIRITPSYWNRDRQMGCIRDVVFRKIHVLGSPGLPLLLSDSRLQGYDEAHTIRNVAFEEIDICGKTPGDAVALGLKCPEYAEGIRVAPAPELPQMQMVETMATLTDASVMSYAASLVGEKVTVGKFDSDNKLQEVYGTVTGTGTMNGNQVIFLDNNEYYLISEILAVGKLPPPKEDTEPDEGKDPDGAGDVEKPGETEKPGEGSGDVDDNKPVEDPDETTEDTNKDEPDDTVDKSEGTEGA